ncbi:DUF1127 domain-containing protein [Marivita sp. S6314]|uniref:DUF1127 domain-containing protein n=1 Tax=Marivita sp. S6314 TaxID=2926406 RepID=UPI001FF53480|nr:DUF1127 domain-containing protein [Marivita sp. S6314]MCK0149081.1 DUF1127 domain-containing protein [Marivita sp. S6314]
MAYQSNITSIAPQSLSEQLSAYITDFRAALARRKVYRNTLNELRTLGPRELDDLGLNRSMLKRIAYQAAYKA